jgi:alpha-1,2-mannosyltransferase
LDRLLTFRRARTYAAVLLGLFVAAWVYELVLGSPPLNAAGAPISGDYIAFHSAGGLALNGRGSLLYDHAAVSAAQDRLLGGRIPGFYDAFRNPPFFALAFVPLALLDLLPGFLVWTALSLACLFVALWLLLQEVPALKPRWRGLLVLVFAFAPVSFGIIDGENATVSLLLYVLIYRALVREQNVLAGVWAALGLFKPQLFIVFPLVFVATRRWRALLAHGLTSGLLVSVSLALVGPGGLESWVRILVEPESSNAMANSWRMMSLKSFLDVLLPRASNLGLGLYVATSVVLLAGLVAVWWPRHRRSLAHAWTFTSLVAVLVDPHLVDYDLSVLVAAGVLASTLIPQLRWWMVVLYLLLFLRVQVPLGEANLQVTPLVLTWCLYLVWLHVGWRGVRFTAGRTSDRYTVPC